eukprot:Nitzschia sp. Nitz4//scaffold71_size96697//1157//2242//NITZ4_004683-RA/size96697-processed-gene-0.102-mRNA-1//1//CDS//3329557211//9391//frame0
MESESVPATAVQAGNEKLVVGSNNIINENDTTVATPTMNTTSNNETASNFGNLLSVWTKPRTATLLLSESSQEQLPQRKIYLLATAESQASTYQGPAKDLVQQVLPDGVFVQLDSKRVMTPSTDGFLQKVQEAVARHDTRIVVPTVDLEDDDDLGLTNHTTMDTQPQAPHHRRRHRHPWWKNLLSMGRTFYDLALGRSPSMGITLCAANVDSLAAMNQGLQTGAKVILGDEDTDVMLTQVLKAIQCVIQREDSEADTTPTTTGTGSNDASFHNSMESIQQGLASMDAIQASLTLSERLKARTPELYQAVYARRSKYMAKALDELDAYDSLVAIVGVSHVEAMKKLLQNKGWAKQSPLPSIT